MKNTFKSVVLGIGLMLVPFAASAAESAPQWSGFYAGAVLGVGVNTPVIDDYDCDLACTSLSLGKFGATYGGTLGVNFPVYNSGVVGLEADFNGTSFDSTSKSVNWPAYHKSKVDWFSTIRARAGLTFEKALVYVTGGVALVDQTTRGSRLSNYECTNGSTNAQYCFAVSGTKTGLAAGAGVEYAVSDNLSWKAEYLYINVPYESALNKGTSCPGATFDYCSYRVSSSMQLFRVGLNYHFYGM